MTPSTRRSAQRKVFIATRRTPEEAAQHFASLQETFETTFDDEEKGQAEFWVLDLSKPPKYSYKYVLEPSKDPIPLPREIPAPCLLVELEGLDEDGQRIVDNARDALKTEPMIAKNVKELIQYLRWFQCMLPFERLPAELENRIRNRVISQGVQESRLKN